jgi:hypothetical protein
VRLANAACDVVAVLALLGAAWHRGRFLTGAFLAATYLNFPRVPLQMELAWYEPMLAALLGCGLLLVGRGWRAGYFLLGLGLTGKQYGVVLLPPLAAALWRDWKALLLGVALAVALVLVPFFLWDPQPFLDTVVVWHLKQSIRKDGVTIQAAALNMLGGPLPVPLLLVTAVALIGWVSWRTRGDRDAPAGPMGAALLLFCLFHSQAFLNYFYLCEYLFLWGMLKWAPTAGTDR